MRQKKEVDILGTTYELTQLGAVQGRKVLAAVTRIVGKAAAGTGGTELSEATLGSAVGGMLEAIDEQTLAMMCETFGQSTQVRLPNGNAPFLTSAIFDEHFAGKYAEMTLWLVECFKLNFADFLDANRRALITSHLGLSKQGSPTDSTGTSGKS